MPDLTPDERQSLREWLEHPATVRLMEWAHLRAEAERSEMRKHIRAAQLSNAAGCEGAASVYESLTEWADNLLVVKPRRAEASE